MSYSSAASSSIPMACLSHSLAPAMEERTCPSNWRGRMRLISAVSAMCSSWTDHSLKRAIRRFRGMVFKCAWAKAANSIPSGVGDGTVSAGSAIGFPPQGRKLDTEAQLGRNYKVNGRRIRLTREFEARPLPTPEAL